MKLIEERTDTLLYSLSKVKLAQWQGLSVGSFLCLCCNYALSLIHPAPHDLCVRVNIQDVPSNMHNGPPFRSQGKTERRRRRTFSQTSDSISLHLSIISPHLFEQSSLHRLRTHPSTVTRCLVRRLFSQTNLLSPYSTTLQDQAVHYVGTRTKAHRDCPSA